MSSPGGVCAVHGAGAVLKWQPIKTTKKGEGADTMKGGDRKYFYVCDLTLSEKKLKQTRLSFQKTTPGRGLDTEQKEGNLTVNTLMNSAGQKRVSARGDGRQEDRT